MLSPAYIEHGAGNADHIPKIEHSLPENMCLPCAFLFAVCSISSTRQTHCLPCAYQKRSGQRTAAAAGMATAAGVGATAGCGRQCSSGGVRGGVGVPSGPHGFFYLLFIFLPGVEKYTRQPLCRVPDRRHTAKDLFTDTCMPCALCRVLHTAKALPCVFRPLLCAFGTRQTRRLP